MIVSNSLKAALISGTALAALGALPGIALAQSSTATLPATGTSSGDAGNEILVTGSRIKQDPNKSALPLQIIRATDLASALARVSIPGLGRMERIAGKDAAEFYPRIYGRTGIIYIQDYWRRTGETVPTGDHIDVWNGYRSSTKWLMEWFSWAGYYSNYAEAKEIWFWEVK